MDGVRRKVMTVACAVLICLLSSNAQTPSNGPVTYTYDELGRLVGVIDSAGNAAVYNYDAVGNILSIQRYTSSQISIIAFTPDHGPEGASVTITGTGFSATPSENTVLFNGTSAVIISSTSTQIVATVPTGASTGPITVTSPAGAVTSANSFKISAESSSPTITGFSPTIGAPGAAVTITGTNFYSSPGNNRIRFNNTADATASTSTNTTLTTAVPSGTGSGHISVITLDGIAVSAGDFFVPFGTFTAASIAATGRITIGASQTVSLAAGQLGMIVFDANRGQRVAIQTSSSTFTGATLYLVGTNGTQLAGTNFGTSAASLYSTTLPLTGTYAVGIYSGAGSGSVNVQVNDASDITGTIAIDGPPVTVTTTIPGQDAWLKFSASADQQIVV